MTRLRKTAAPAGRIVFVGAGPGDPGMLTTRALAAELLDRGAATLMAVRP